MKYYIGKVPQEYIEQFGSHDLFEHEGEFFYNSVEFGSNPGGIDDITISDTCDRSIPISTDIISVLIATLLDIRNTLHTIDRAEQLQDQLQDAGYITTLE